MGNYVAAIDLGTTKVVTIVGQKSAGGVKIIAYSEAPSNGVMRGEVVNIQKVYDSLLPTIEDVKKQIADEEYELRDVYVGIAGQNIRCDANSIIRHRPNPNILINKSEVASMLEDMYGSRVAPGEQVLHVIPQSYNVDDHIGVVEAEGMDGKEVEGNYRIFIGKVNSTTHSESVITRSKLHLSKLILEPIASARATLTEDEMELGVAMVDIGGGTTDLLIYYDNIIRHVAVIPFGGNSITNDIRQICGVSLRHAEALKKQHGSCISEFAPDNKTISITSKDGINSKEVSFKLLANAIEARVCEIIATVMYEIEKSSYKEKLKAGIVLTGGTANLNHIQNLTRQITGYNVRIAIPDNNVLMSTSLEEVYKPSASTAVGLVLKGFDFKEEYKEEETPASEAPYTNIFGEESPEPLSADTPSTSKPKQPKGPKGPSIKKRLGGLLDDLFTTDDQV